MELEGLKKRYRLVRSTFGEVLYGFPANKLKLIGVTGTSGKSTTSFMIYHMLKEQGLKVGLLSTVGAIAGEERLDTGLHVTTPDPIRLQRLLSIMKSKGVEYVVLECSSHALAQKRLGLLKFNYAIFTNIKRDHLDWHKTWDNYAEAKATLIDRLFKDGVAFVNEDDHEAYTFLRKRSKNKGIKLVSYSAKKKVKDLAEMSSGLYFKIDSINFEVPILGSYNADNILAAVTLGIEMGFKLETIAEVFTRFEGVEGRMQIIKQDPFTVIIDFAHNVDSLRRSLESARMLAGEGKKVIAVFGSAGLRDVEKREQMGEVSGRLADITIVAAEDPRTEELYAINSAIIKGAENAGAKFVKRFKDSTEYVNYEPELSSKERQIFAFDEESVNSRYDAVDFALKIAKSGDVVITEGKGHEKSLCFGTTEYPYSDQEAIIKALENLENLSMY